MRLSVFLPLSGGFDFRPSPGLQIVIYVLAMIGSSSAASKPAAAVTAAGEMVIFQVCSEKQEQKDCCSNADNPQNNLYDIDEDKGGFGLVFFFGCLSIGLKNCVEGIAFFLAGGQINGG